MFDVPDPVLELGVKLLTPLVTAGAERLRKNDFHPITTSEQRSIAGDWEGNGADQYVENGQLIAIKVFCSVKMKRNRVSAEATVTPSFPDVPTVKLAMDGGFFNSSLVQLAYRSTDPVRVQFGVVLLRLSSTGETVHGHYAGLLAVSRVPQRSGLRKWRMPKGSSVSCLGPSESCSGA